MEALPNELLSCIIHCLRPSGSPLAIPTTHEVTKTLLSLTRVSLTIRSLAVPCLYTYCLYIDSPRRLQLLLRTLSREIDTLQGKGYAAEGCPSRNAIGSSLLVHRSGVLRSLYLAPFIENTIDELLVVTMIGSLFELLSPFLTRLVIDMPLRSLYPEDDTQEIRPILRDAFRKLTFLEEFTSARDELFLATCKVEGDEFVREPPVWSSWPQLKHLVLYNVDIDCEDFIDGVLTLQNLEVIVLTRADGQEQDATLSKLQRMKALKRILMVNARDSYLDYYVSTFEPCWWTQGTKSDDKVAEIFQIEVPIPDGDHSSYESDEIEACQVWTRDKAISGELWNQRYLFGVLACESHYFRTFLDHAPSY